MATIYYIHVLPGRCQFNFNESVVLDSFKKGVHSLLDKPITARLKEIFLNVRQYLLQPNISKELVGSNPRGDTTLKFDFEAEKIIINHLISQFPNSRILSEEIGLVNESIEDYDYLFVIDPVDGSKNYQNGIPLVGLTIAVLKPGVISTENVIHGFIGNIYSGSFLSASKGKGALINDQPVKQNPNAGFDNGVLSCSLNGFDPEHFFIFQDINRAMKQMRSFGSSSIELSYVIQGNTAAHVDFRKRLSAENFLAAALILAEAGGKLTDLYGNPIVNIPDLSEGYSILATHLAEDHDKFLNLLWGKSRLN